ncbi:MAG TPA: PPOX class F420-dependent oxidoreductase [Candidatus Sulfomarinibacteraceae bacterium]|nr:PPOX class F420-dependent oxidoreductase [Candidatus Sulfomarinibacteraceae bacterium]
MSVAIPESHQWLLEDVVVATLGTLMPDGAPQVHKIWFDYDGAYIRINTAEGRQKEKNLRARPYATVLLTAPDNPYFYLELRGEVAERVLGPEADAHVGTLAQRYLGQASFEAPGEVRVMYKIEPKHVVAYGERD